MGKSGKFVSLAVAVLAFSSLYPAAQAGPLRDLLRERMAEHRQQQGNDAEPAGPAALPAGVSVQRDVRYGNAALQRFDVYLPPHPSHAPVILMVHGGGWRTGDKALRSVVENKVAHWVPKGFILVSTDYRLLPAADPLQQADDIAAALAAVQRQAASWGGDPGKLVLMGHSAGAHLVSLLAASPSIAASHGATRWLGTVALDSAVFDVAMLMEHRHFSLYDDAFGSDRTFWTSTSPYQQLQSAGAPFLAVCSSRRKESCPQAHRFVTKAGGFGMRASVLEQDLSHREINQHLGGDGAYTSAVDRFIATLDPALAKLL